MQGRHTYNNKDMLIPSIFNDMEGTLNISTKQNEWFRVVEKGRVEQVLTDSKIKT